MTTSSSSKPPAFKPPAAGSPPAGNSSSSTGSTPTRKPFPSSNQFSSGSGSSSGSRPPGGNFSGPPRPFTPRPPGSRPPGAGGGYKGRFFKDQSPDQHRINGRINAREVFVITEAGEQLGVLPIFEALKVAEERALDLVEVSPEAKPPVCKLMDYGKFKYKEQKKKNEAKKKQVDNTIKELRIRYSTDKGDLDTKLKHAREFLTEGDKVKFVMRFKGREVMFMDLGLKKFAQIELALADIGKIDDRSPTRGRQIHIVFIPLK